MKHNYIRYIFIVISLIVFSLVTINLLNGNITILDNYVFNNFVSRIRNNSITTLFKFITFFSGVAFIIISTILILVFTKKRIYAIYITMNVICCFLLNQSIKFLFARSRPSDINLITESGYSYPSGHSMMSLAFYGLLIYFVVKSNFSKFTKIILSILLVLLIMLIGFSRIYLGVHYTSDVIAGFSLSLAYLMMFIDIINKKNVRKI